MNTTTTSVTPQSITNTSRPFARGAIIAAKRNEHWNAAPCNDTVRLAIPLHWKKPRRVFVNSMSDLFHEDVPFEFIDRVFAVMALCPQHTFQVLTKRPERMAEYFNIPVVQEFWPKVAGFPETQTLNRSQVVGQRMRSRLCECSETLCQYNQRVDLGCAMQFHAGYNWPLRNVQLGTSVENQQAADQRIPHLLRCPAAVRFLSLEPLLGPVDLRAKCPPEFRPFIRDDRINWLIIGGESGPGARPCNVQWIRSLVQQGQAAGVPVFVKQLGSRAEFDGAVDHAAPFRDRKGGDPAEWPADLRVRQWPGGGE